jgi:hypothetical protein
MNAHAFSSPAPLAVDSRRNPARSSVAAPRTGPATNRHFLDFSGRSVHLDGANVGAVAAWYFGVTPCRDATVIAVGGRAWDDGMPGARTQAHAAALIEQGVSVLLVDMRRSEHVWSTWIGCTPERILEAAMAYLEDRGYDIESARFVHAC